MATLDEVLTEARANAVSRIESSRPKIGFADIRIQTKDKRIVPFIPNVEQTNLLNDCVPGWENDDFSCLRAIRELILKARQLGFSTLVEILFFINTINTKNTRTVVVSKDQDTSDNIFLMVKMMYDHLPAEKKPVASTTTTTEYYWPELNSRYESHTAGGDGIGRSLTIHNLHWSEVAHSRSAQNVASGLLGAVPPEGNVFLETTANGFGEFFHQEWIKAENGESSYHPRFASWLDNPDYELDPDTVPPFKDEKDLEKEHKLREIHNLTERQLAFRRWKMREPGMRRDFVQEFPLTPKEAFISSGNPFFDNDSLNDLFALYSKNSPRYSAEIDFLRYDKLIKSFSEGDFLIFDLPQQGEYYAIGADPAEGLTNSGLSDYCAAPVLRVSDGKQVAILHGKWDPKSFAALLDQVGRWYNSALLGVERNNHGHAVILALIEIYNYPNLYEHEEYDQKTEEKHKKPGYPTTSKTRTLALDSLSTALMFNELLVYDLGTLSELMSFVKLPGGKYAAEKGCHDDRVMALAIARMMLDQPMYSPVVPSHTSVAPAHVASLLRIR